MIQEVVFKIHMHAGFVCDIVTENEDYSKHNKYDVREKDIFDRMSDITYAMNNMERRACLFEVA